MLPTEPRRIGIIGRVIAGSARNPLVTILLIGGLALWGWLALRRAPLDAIPDLSDAQVIIFTEWMGRSPDLIEDRGHTFGADRPDADKLALIEFLKTL